MGENSGQPDHQFSQPNDSLGDNQGSFQTRREDNRNVLYGVTGVAEDGGRISDREISNNADTRSLEYLASTPEPQAEHDNSGGDTQPAALFEASSSHLHAEAPANPANPQFQPGQDTPSPDPPYGLTRFLDITAEDPWCSVSLGNNRNIVCDVDRLCLDGFKEDMYIERTEEIHLGSIDAVLLNSAFRKS